MKRWIRRLWTEEEFAQLETLWESGVHISEIAIRLDRAATAVKQRATMRGLRRPDGYFGYRSHKVVKNTTCQE